MSISISDSNSLSPSTRKMFNFCVGGVVNGLFMAILGCCVGLGAMLVTNLVVVVV